MTEISFCTKCGAEMRDDMTFCPKCGAVRAGSETEKERIAAMEEMALEGRFMWLRFLLIIYGIPAIIIGITEIIYAGPNANTLLNNADFVKWLDEMHIDHSFVKTAFQIAGGLAIVSGIGACVSLYAVAKRKMWIVAFVGCLIATIFSIWSLFGVIIGIFVCWMIWDCKPFFDDEKKPDTPDS